MHSLKKLIDEKNEKIKMEEKSKYLKIAEDELRAVSESPAEEEIQKLMEHGKEYYKIYPDIAKKYFKKVEDYIPEASRYLGEYYFGVDDELYLKYMQKAAENGDEAAKKKLFAYYIKHNDKKNASFWYKKLDDDTVEATPDLARFYVKNGEYQLAEEIYLEIYENNKKNEDALYDLASFYNFIGDREESRKWFSKIADEDYIEATYRLGAIYFEKGEVDKAEYWYRKAMEKGSVHAMNNLGFLYSQIGYFEKSEHCYRMGYEAGDEKGAKPNLINLYFKRGNMYAENKNYREAEKYFMKILDMGEKSVYSNIASIYNLQGDPEKAKEWLIKGADEGDETSMLNLSIFVYSKENDIEKMRYWLLRLAEKQNVIAIYELGNLAVRTNNIEEAKSWYTKAALKNSREAVNKLIEIYTQQNNVTELAKWVKRLEELNFSDQVQNNIK